MVNPHPPLSSFPFVLIVLLLIIELLSLNSADADRWNGVTRFLVFALCAALPLTYFSGYFGADFAHRQFEVPDEAILKHQLWAKLSLLSGAVPVLLFFLADCSRSERPGLARRLRAVFRLSLLVLALFLARVSFLGGELVFSHGAGVEVHGQK